MRRTATVLLAGWLPVLAETGDHQKEWEPFLERHCYKCHDDIDEEGGLNLLDLEFDPADRNSMARWTKVFDMVERGEMPPEKEERPSGDSALKFKEQLSAALVSNQREHDVKFGRAALRRLNREEYQNTLRELLRMPSLDVAEMLPPDGMAHGFNKSSEALDFSHVQVDRYLEVADMVLRGAMAERRTAPESQLTRLELKSVEGVKEALQTLYVQLKQGTGAPLIGTKPDRTLVTYRGNFAKREPGYVRDPEPKFDGVATFMNSRDNHNITIKHFNVEVSGWYKLRVRGFGLLNDHGKILPSDRTETVAFYVKGGRLLGRCDVPPNVPTTVETVAWIEAGEPIDYLAVSTPSRDFKLPGDKLPPYPWHHFKSHGIGLQAFEMEGPISVDPQDAGNESLSWPPKSHRVLFGNHPLRPAPENERGYVVVPKDPGVAAEQLVKRFVRRALRRPVWKRDFELPLSIAREKLEAGWSFEEAMIAAYRAVLCSPDFLLISHERSEDVPRLTDHALASRLSYFLWSSPPDEELRRLAAKGELSGEGVLAEQVERLLDDRTAQRFVDHFLDYWLDLRNSELTQPDFNLYPEYKHIHLESMLEESRAYFAEMVREDLGVAHVIDADFAMLNQTLAELYDVPGVQGSEIRRVGLPEGSVRGGFLTQASLLKVTANGTTTSPVTRGVFVLDRILGDHPPSPPESVPAVEPDLTGVKTIRQQLAKHRADPACAGCHQKIDPPGFALESFDVMGVLRTNYRAAANGEPADAYVNGKRVAYRHALPVDSAGVMPDGGEFEDITEFRKHLARSERQIARNMLERLVVYATGTPARFADRPVVEAMLDRLSENGYGMRSMIHEVVGSDLFRNK